MVKAALTNYIHVHMGRADVAMEPAVMNGVRSDGRGLRAGETYAVQEYLKHASEVLTGTSNGGPSIFNPIVSNVARLAYKVAARMDGDALREGMVDAEGNPTKK